MYPSRFRYEAPRSLEEAIELLRLGGGEAKVLAGGQSLVPMLKLRFASPEMVVDINNISGLDYHRVEPDGTIHIGALCRHADLENSAILRAHQPTMAAAAPVIADPIVRNRGTLVGSLCHADPQGDWASVMIALGGSIIAQGPNGRRSIAVADFVKGPFQNVLAFDELAIEAVIPAPNESVVLYAPPTGTHSTDLDFVKRHVVQSLSVCSLAAKLYSSPQHRLHNILVTSTTAEISRKSPSNFILCGIWVCFKQCLCRQHHSRRTESALQSMLVLKAFLDRM